MARFIQKENYGDLLRKNQLTENFGEIVYYDMTHMEGYILRVHFTLTLLEIFLP